MTYNLLQTSFATGVVSSEAAARLDVQKIQSALLTADNCIIRPYGSFYKRPGLIFSGRAKYAGKKIIFRAFNVSDTVCYLLEIGEEYIRVWRDGAYQGVELKTPYRETDLPLLRFAQSSDNMFIASGKYPVKALTVAGDTWAIADYPINIMPFMPVNPDEGLKITPSGTAGDITLTASGDVFTAGMAGTQMKIEHNTPPQVLSITEKSAAAQSAQLYVGKGGTCGVAITGSWTGAVYLQENIGGWRDAESYTENGTYTGVSAANYVRLRLSIATGSVTAVLTMPEWNGAITVSLDKAAGTTLLCGQTGWRILTGGTWTGTIALEKSEDKETWDDYHLYTSNNDFNVSDNGTFDTPTWVRIVPAITGGTVSITFTALGYTHTGIVKITSVSQPTEAGATVVKSLGSTAGTDLWYPGAFSDDYGYPRCVSFFQDRLALAGSDKQQNGVWFSRTGDYPDFSEERAQGKLTDDSAISFNILAREFFDIRHIVPATDFILFTSGNEWKLSGSAALTPTNINAQIQTSWGSGQADPLLVGNRIIYAQRRGAKVRDMGYSYESDNYTGDDLTIFIQHLTDGHSFIDCAYSQQPDSLIYFVREDGVMLCLTYMREQNVFAWSVIKTDGRIESVAVVAEGENDRVYVAVVREIGGQEIRYIERFSWDAQSDDPSAHVMLDAAKIFVRPGKILTGLGHLAGRSVKVVGDDKLFPDPDGFLVSEDGRLELPYECGRVVVGLPYRMRVDLIDVINDVQCSGSTFGKAKGVGKIRLKVKRSFGGKVYATDETRTKDIFAVRLGGLDVLTPRLNVQLLTGYEEAVTPSERNVTANCGIIHDEPYPFNVAAVSREVLISGG